MAITKQVKVTFNVTAVMDSETEALLAKQFVALCGQIKEGKVKDHKSLHLATVFVEQGMDGVAAYLIKHGLRNGIKDMHKVFADAEQFRFSPARVEVIK